DVVGVDPEVSPRPRTATAFAFHLRPQFRIRICHADRGGIQPSFGRDIESVKKALGILTIYALYTMPRMAFSPSHSSTHHTRAHNTLHDQVQQPPGKARSTSTTAQESRRSTTETC